MALSANLDTKRKAGKIIRYPLLADATIYKGALVVDKGTGYASAGATGGAYTFLGVAVEKVVESDSIDGSTSIRVYKSGTFVFSKTSAAQTDIGQPMYIVDDETVGTSGDNSILAGYCVDVPDSSHVRVRIDRGVDSTGS